MPYVEHIVHNCKVSLFLENHICIVFNRNVDIGLSKMIAFDVFIFIINVVIETSIIFN